MRDKWNRFIYEGGVEVILAIILVVVVALLIGSLIGLHLKSKACVAQGGTWTKIGTRKSHIIVNNVLVPTQVPVYRCINNAIQ